MATYTCPKGHESTESDYCSECGARIEGAIAVPASAPAPIAALASVCPECGAKREQHDVIFCEICGYNFATGAPGDMIPPPVALAPDPAPAAPVAPAAAPDAWAVEISVDPTLREPGSPDPPIGFAPFTISLQQPASLIGRKSTARAIYPELDLSYDAAVSHRHALLQLTPAGALFLRDIGASNGTRLNGQHVEPLKDHPLASGDQITLGHWSRIAVKAQD